MKKEYHYHPHEFWILPIIIFALSSFVTIMLYRQGSASFSGQTFLNGDSWRIFLFPFAHFSFNHFFENLVGLFIASLLAFEVNISKLVYFFAFFGASFSLASLATFMFPDILMAGASVGIYAILGAVALKGSKFFRGRWLLLLFIFTIFLKAVFSIMTGTFENEILLSTAFHFFGFAAGFFIFAIYSWKAKEKVYF